MRTWSTLVVTLALVGLVGCGKNNESACSSASDCAGDQVCEDGVCQAPPEDSCSDDFDCRSNERCVANRCEVRVEPDMGAGDVSNNDNNNVPDAGEDASGGDDVNFDNIPPEVVEVTPADGTIDVTPDTAVTVEFNEAMRAATINLQSIEIRDPANNAVPADVTYDEESFTATITPTAVLRQATPYRVVVTTRVRDEAFNEIANEHETKFYTIYEEPAELRTLAETWAPHIYQSLGETTGGGPNADIPTTVNFDSNFKARDNKGKAVLASTKTTATVHYNVVESQTHYFITYSMYYPVRTLSDSQHEHDFAGAVLVIDKATDKLILVDGTKVQPGVDTVLGFKPDDSTVAGPAVAQFETFPASAMEDGTHYPMFITAGEHETCNWVVEGNPPVCLHNASEFPGGDDMGVVLKPGANGQKWEDATTNQDTGLLELTYELVPLSSTLWVRRTDVGTEQLWEQTAAYDPSGTDRPAVTSGGSPVMLPNKLVSDDETSFGKPPFQWLRTSTESNGGQWLIDPTYLLLNRYDIEEPWSQEYCYNIFLDIDLRGDANTPECEGS